MSKKYIGTTIHTGWFPLLADKGPAKAFHASKSNRGVSARGYSKAFVKHVKAIERARGKNRVLSLLATPILTQLGAAAAAGEYAGDMLDDTMMGSAETRPRRWSDMVMDPSGKKDKKGNLIYDDASRFEDGVKKFQLRGNFVWYNKPSGGPKALAKAILENNFSFENAEKWYKAGYSRAGAGMRDWATATLGMRGNKFIKPEEIEKIGKVVGETVLKGDKELDKIEGYDTDKTTAQTRDISFKGSPAEISEMKISETHGYPKISAEDKADNEALKTVIQTHAVDVWNKTVDKIIATEQKALKKRGKPSSKADAGLSAIGKSSAKLIAETGADISVDQMRRVKHEMADKILWLGANQSKSDFTDILRADSEVDKHGMKSYHRINLSMDRDFKFALHEVTTITGMEAGQAFMENEKASISNSYKKSSLARQIAFAHNFGKNTDATRKHGSMTLQTLNNTNLGVGIKTEVSFSPKVAKDYVDNIIDRIGELTKEKLTGKEKEIQNAVRKKAEAYNQYGNIFWAAPYIGIEEGLNLG